MACINPEDLAVLDGTLHTLREDAQYIGQGLVNLNEHDSGRRLKVGQDPSRLKYILSMEREEHQYRALRVRFLSEVCRINQLVIARSAKLSESLSDDPVLMKATLEELRLAFSSAEFPCADFPSWLVEKVILLLKELGSRCTNAFARWVDPRAGKLGPLLDNALKIWQLKNTNDSSGMSLSERDTEEDESLKFPNFIYSLSRDIEDMLRSKFQIIESNVDKLFGLYCGAAHTLFKTKIAGISDPPRSNLSSSSPAIGSRIYSEFLDETLTELQRLWILTLLLFGERRKAHKTTPSLKAKMQVEQDHTLLSILFTTKYVGVSEGKLLSFSQLINETVNAASLALLKLLLKKVASPETSLEFAVKLLRMMYDFYGSSLGPLYFVAVMARKETDTSAVIKHFISLLSEQQPLVEIVSFVLKAIKGTPIETHHEVLASLLWNQVKEHSASNQLVELYSHCSLLAALSSFTSSRTNSKQLVLDFLQAAVTSGQDKGSHARVTVQKFMKYLNEEAEGKELSTKEIPPNILDLIARKLFLQQMPTIPQQLSAIGQSTGEASPAASNKTTRQPKSLAKFV